jgi:hypothetical protein
MADHDSANSHADEPVTLYRVIQTMIGGALQTAAEIIS